MASRDWGGRHTSKDYKMMMSGDNPLRPPVSLVGHAITSPSQNLEDPVTRRYTEERNGRIVTREEVVRAAEQLSMTITILTGNALQTPALQAARDNQRVTPDFYAQRLDPDPKAGHTYIYPETSLLPPSRVNDVITVDDTVMIDWQFEARTEEELILLEVFGYQAQAGGGDALYDAVFLRNGLDEHGNLNFNSLVAVGGAGGAGNSVLILLTDDRFATTSSPATVPAPDATVGTSVWNKDDVILVGFADDSDPATATLGGTLISVDGGDTFSLDSDISDPIHDVGWFAGRYIAVGGTGTGGGYIGTSEDGASFTAVTGSLPAAASATSLAVDGQYAYVTFSDGTLYRLEDSAGTVVATEVTGLPGTPTALHSVDVKDTDQIAVGGASGYYAETVDGGLTWSQPQLGTTSTVSGLTGNRFRSLSAAGSSLTIRDVETGMNYSPVEIAQNATLNGNLTSVRDLGSGFVNTDELNYFVATTDTGQVLLVKSDSPFE